MNNFDKVFDSLIYAREKYGLEIIYKTKQLRSILIDLTPEAQGEINIFINAVSQREIVKSIQDNRDISFNYDAKQIANNTGLSKYAAKQVSLAIFNYFDIQADIILMERSNNENIEILTI